MLVRHRPRKSYHPRSGFPGRGRRLTSRGSDIILIALAGLLVLAAILTIFLG